MKNLLFSFFLISASIVHAQLSVSKFFSDHMVLQRNMPVTIWGKAGAEEIVKVTFRNGAFTTTADTSGEWVLTMGNYAAGGPFVLKITSRNEEIVLSDILVGDVWLCSGQSNMEWPVSKTIKADSVMQSANYKNIRHFNVLSDARRTPQSQLPENNGGWQVCSPKTVGDFTGVGYYFGLDLYNELDVPIGLVNSTWGGSGIQAWMSDANFTDQELQNYIDLMVEKRFENRKHIEQELNSKHDIPENDPGIQNGEAVWADPALDDTSWKTVAVPGNWQAIGLGQFDGIVWYRKEFELETIPKTAALGLAAIDDGDETWVNGTKVGETPNSWDTYRKYDLPKGVLKKGKNVVTVRIEDLAWGGGIHGEADSVAVFTDFGKIPLAGDWNYSIGESLKTPFPPNETPTLLYNGMIHPLLNASFAGVIWYQGESNATSSSAYNYRFLFEHMISQWRKDLNQPNLPFLWVQLANFKEAVEQPSTHSYWALARESQSYVLKTLQNVGEAVIIDVGEANDIHPRDKHTVGKRLSLAAQAIAYQKELVYSGPTFKAMESQGDKLILTFDHIGSGLKTKDGNTPSGFAIAGEDGIFKWAKAYLENDAITVWSDAIEEPKYVRYGWEDNPVQANIYNNEGLPMNPFRTDKIKY